MSETFELREEFITLGQLLKFLGQIQTGGEARTFLAEIRVRVNGEREARRGRKLYAGDVVEIPGESVVTIAAPSGPATAASTS
ncbi:MAG: S4 domain-containing protein YaaA [Capsulimonadales bacterium]|nr:S4 domain-containing protein YaaA [Capsulimonadales bacterium]